MFTRLIDHVLESSWLRVQRRKKLEQLQQDTPRPLLATADGPPTTRFRQFTVHDAMNGTYIEFMKRKYNPNGPDEYAREIYLVQPGESLIDAISTVLVLTEK
jgi:hypothetical protein